MRERTSIAKKETIPAPAIRPPPLPLMHSRAMRIAKTPISMMILMLPPSSCNGQRARREIHGPYLWRDFLEQLVLPYLRVRVESSPSARDCRSLTLSLGYDRLLFDLGPVQLLAFGL